MSRVGMTALVCVVAIGGGVGWYALNPRPSSTQPNPPTVRLAVPSGALDLGVVWETDEHNWIVPIENREAFPVTVESFSASCTCVSIDPQSFTLDPGDRRDVRLKLDLTAKQAAKAEDDVTIRLRPIVKAGPDGLARTGPEWTVHARVRRVFSLGGSTYVGRHSELAQPVPPHDIPVTLLVPVESLAATCDHSGFAVSVVPTAQNEKERVLRLTPTSPLPVGAFEGTVSLHPALKGETQLPMRRIGFKGVIVPDVEPDPPAVQVGGRRLKESFEESVGLRSLTNRPTTVIRVDAEGEGLSVVAEEGGQRYRVRQIVCQAGTQTNRVRFTVESGGNRHAVELPITYTGYSTEDVK